MRILKAYRLELILAFFAILLYFSSRFLNILSLPIFTDEAIYVRWSQIANQDSNWRFISLTDGKQPSFVWATMVFLRFISDPLLAGRLVSVMAGFFTMVGLFLLTYELFKSRKIAFLTSLLYILYPFAIVYDRMALYESLVAMFFILSLYLEVLLVKKIRLDVALLLGLIIGGGVLTKTTGFLSIYLLPITLLLFNFKQKDWKLNLLKLIGYSSISIALAYTMYAILRLSPFFHIINEKNAIFVYPFSEWVKHPIDYFVNNLGGLMDWLLGYMTIPVFLLIPFSIVIGMRISHFFKKFFSIYIIGSIILLTAIYLILGHFPYTKVLPFPLFGLVFILFLYALYNNKPLLQEKLLLFLWFLIPIAGLALFGNNLYPRYVFFMSLPLLPLIGYALINLAHETNKRIAQLAILLSLSLFVVKGYYIIFDFPHSPIPNSDLNQYSNDWPAGGGVKEAVTFFQEESKKGKVFVGTQGSFGLMPYALEIYLSNNPNVTIKGFWPIKDQPPLEILEASIRIPTYMVFYQPCSSCEDDGIAPIAWPLTEILRIKKGPYSYLTVYKVTPK